MTALEIEVMIDGEKYSEKELARIEYERGQHVLHELKRLGVDIRNDDKSLSDEDINLLDSKTLKQISVDTRINLGYSNIQKLLKAQLKRSDNLWRELVNRSNKEAQHKISSIDIKVTGQTIQALGQKLGQLDETAMIKSKPEHYAATNEEGKNISIETIGMCGLPTAFTIEHDPDFKPEFKKEPGYNGNAGGRIRLASDNTDLDMFLVLQMKPMDNGFQMKISMYMPENVSQDFVDGHKFFMALEFSHGLEIASSL